MKKSNNPLLEKIFKYPLLILVIITVITIVLGIQIRKLVIDNDTANFLPDDNPARIEYRRIEDVYGGGMVMAVCIKVKDGYVYSRKNLLIIEQISNEIEKIKDISQVTSIINADYLAGTEDGIETMKLIDKIPENETEEKAIIERLNSWKIYKGNLFSNDYKSTMIAIRLKLGAKNVIAEEAYRQVKRIINKYESSGFDFYVAGLPSVLVVMAGNLRNDLARLVPFVVIILLITLFLSFKKIIGVILPTVTVLIATVCIMGLMAFFKINLTMIASALPVLMIAVGSAYGIHVISHYYDEIDNEFLITEKISIERNKKIIFITIKRIGWAVFLAAITTICGFGSLAASKIKPLKEFGFFTAIGVFIAFFIAITLIPAVFILRHKALNHKQKNTNLNKSGINKALISGVLINIYRFFSKSKLRTVTLLSVILLISIYGTMNIITGNPMVNYFRKSTEIRKSDAFVNENFNGTTIIDIIIKGKAAGSLTNPDILYAIDNLSSYLENKYTDAVFVMSFADLVKKMNQVMNVDEKGDYYEIPYNPEKYRLSDKNKLKQLIAQYLLLFSGNIDDYVDDPIEPSETKISVIIKNPDFNFIKELKREIHGWTLKNFPSDYEMRISGNANIQVVVSDFIIESQIMNILSSLLAVFLILSIYYRSLNAGIYGIVTLAIPIFLNFGFMGLLKIRLDAGTAMIASVAIGIGIDYTIHFMNAYHHERKITDNLDTVTIRSLESSGKAIVFNAVAVALGFLVLVFSNFLPLVSFGSFVAFTMFTSSLASMTILPILLNIFKPKFISR
ncbi:MAG: RND family transporter [Spirochaetes bacterium]|nr:RND family transporter [Spirochaetota bacterium]